MKIKWFALGALVLLLAGCQRVTWKEFTSKEGRFSVLVPGTPTEQTQKLDTPAGPIELHFFVVEQDGFQYLVSYNDYPDAMVREASADKVLDGSRNGVVANVQGRLLNEAKVWLADYPGRELRIKIPEGRQAMRTRLYFVKNRLYQVGVLSAEDGAAADEIGKFLNSFKLVYASSPDRSELLQQKIVESMWYWLLNITIALWVFFDARKRKMQNALIWAIGTFLIMILVIPFYLATRPLRAGEAREGGTAWNVLKSFALFWTLLMFVAGVSTIMRATEITSKVTSGAGEPGGAIATAIGIGAAVGVGMILGLWFVILVGALAIGLFVKKSSVVELGPTGPLAE